MYLRMDKAGKLPLERLVTQTYTLEEINQGNQDMHDGKNLRGLVLYGDDDYEARAALAVASSRVETEMPGNS